MRSPTVGAGAIFVCQPVNGAARPRARLPTDLIRSATALVDVDILLDHADAMTLNGAPGRKGTVGMERV